MSRLVTIVDLVKFVGLSGIIGAGKSTVGRGLAGLGAHVLDVDVLTRELQEPGEIYYEQIVAEWGPSVVGIDGRLDREALASTVFSDRAELGKLTLMAAPLIEAAIVERASPFLGTDDAVICEAAMYLLPMYGMSGLMVVDTPVEVALHRLVTERGMAEADARQRMASQLPRETRLEHADLVIDNSGTTDDLKPHVDATWTWIMSRPDSVPTLPQGPADHA